ncbi:MotE family protein [Virgibacillus senegalensis]|uniref:MotE family protein n=1 Tax=Virgibacillus senegalensis TaxID=1499679 RepID=UPI00069FF038|nr:hypothetical protein [Virgibacillus senegalensis]
MASKSEHEKKKPGILQWLLFILIPLILAGTIAIIIMIAAGIDVSGFAKKYGSQIPGVSSLVSEETEYGEAEQQRLTAAIDSRDEQIDQLESELEAREADIEDLNEQINTLHQQLETQQEAAEEEPASNVIKDISTSFQNMETDRAAEILANLEDDTALAVMGIMSKKTLGEILGEMDAEEAARLTNAYASEETQ